MTDGERTVLVTGAASGIGRAAAALAESRSWKVLRVDQHEGDIVCDLGTPDGRQRLVQTAGRMTGGRLDAVIACAGVVGATPATIAVNYFGMVGTLAGLRPLLARGTAPRAVCISSYGAIAGPPDPDVAAACVSGDEGAALAASAGKSWDVLYGTSKYLIAKWVRTQAVSEAWAGAGIILNSILPGVVLTPMIDMVNALGVDDRKAEIGFTIPLGRPAAPDEAAELLLWLASEANSYMTGQLLFIDGGAEAAARPDTI